MTDAVLTIEDLHKTYDPGLFEKPVEVLRGLDLEVRRGEIFGFLGANGAGKTTTLKAITGLIRPDRGTVTICGLPGEGVEARRRLGFMPENPYFYQHLTGDEFLRFFSELLGIERSAVPDRIDGVLDRVSMAEHRSRPMRTYSKGMLQRMALAQALLGSPELLILDEPMSGLDPLGRRDVRDIILAERERGVTVFFSSHVIPDVEALCDRVAILADGRILAVGSVPELVVSEAEAYEATFVGLEAEALQTPVIARHTGSDASWARVAGEHRDRLIEELTGRGARLLGLTPVRSSLEEFLVKAFDRGGAS